MLWICTVSVHVTLLLLQNSLFILISKLSLLISKIHFIWSMNQYFGQLRVMTGCISQSWWAQIWNNPWTAALQPSSLSQTLPWQGEGISALPAQPQLRCLLSHCPRRLQLNPWQDELQLCLLDLLRLTAKHLSSLLWAGVSWVQSLKLQRGTETGQPDHLITFHCKLT